MHRKGFSFHVVFQSLMPKSIFLVLCIIFESFVTHAMIFGIFFADVIFLIKNLKRLPNFFRWLK